MNIKTKNYYDDFSGWYERERGKGYHELIDELETGIIKPVAEGKLVLEVGAGTGLLMKRIDNLAAFSCGIDLSMGMLEAAKKRDLNVAQATADNLPFPDESFDLVYSFKVLAHVQPIRQTMAEMSRVLKPGGYLVAEFYNLLSVRRLSKWVGGPGRISKDRKEDDVFTRWDTPKKILSYLPDNLTFENFQGVRVFTPFAGFVDLPVLGTILKKAEKMAVKSPLSRFGGFLVAVCKKK